MNVSRLIVRALRGIVGGGTSTLPLSALLFLLLAMGTWLAVGDISCVVDVLGAVAGASPASTSAPPVISAED